ncbi:MAG: hypothetical protein JNM36_07825 [Chitinophagales bacterium]|nr:hypothetical protein [Chitinophagales bacterium]
MLTHTQSFNRLKKEQQEILDFAVLVCHAIPNIKKTIRGEEEGIPYFSLANPDYFSKEAEDRIKKLSKHYKENLSKYLIISSFSFFEAYFKAVIEEMMDFHGGKESLINNVKERHKRMLETIDDTVILDKRKLQEPPKRKNKMRYEKHISQLQQNASYRMPSELFAAIGAKYILDLVSSDRFRSAMIPDLLEYGFLMDLNSKINKSHDLREKNLKETFDSMRDIRNRISHGDNPTIDFAKAMDYVRFLRNFAIKIDKHLIEHFFVLESSSI